MRLKLYAKLQQDLNCSRTSIDNFCRTAPNKYKVYTIPKRTSGVRVIAHPSRPLKLFQRSLLKILGPIKGVHQASYAYRKGTSIRDNALKHSHSRYMLKMDFKDFFNSLIPDMLYVAMCEHGVVLSNAEKRTLTRLLFWNKTKSFNEKLVLSVGAPSSPLVSNIIMYKFDKALSEKCLSSKITYTRYADDLTFSTNQKGILFEVPSIVRNLLGEIFQHRISLNESKTIFTSKAHNRHVTGVTINNEGQLSIGRERKRMISAMVHKYKNDGLSEVDSSYLAGLISFALHIEPTFIERLKVKYGERVLYNISRGTSNGN